MPGPVFVACCERSGSTLLRHMLNHHPDIAWSGGFTFSVDLVGDDGSYPALADYYRFLETNRVFHSAALSIDRNLGYADLIRDFLRQLRERAGKRIAGGNVYRHFHRLLFLFPECRFLHLVRDGRDVSRSWVGTGWAGNVWCAAARWREAEQCWERLRQRLDAGRCHEVRYEELVARPEQTLRGICEFIGVPYSLEMLEYPRTTRYTTPDPALIDQWRVRLRPREIQLLEERLGTMLAARGYALSGLPRIRVGRWQRLWLRQEDRYRRVRARGRRNGWALVISEILARFLCLRSWHRSIQLRLNALEVKRLR
jgi:hypothetical protein